MWRQGHAPFDCWRQILQEPLFLNTNKSWMILLQQQTSLIFTKQMKSTNSLFITCYLRIGGGGLHVHTAFIALSEQRWVYVDGVSLAFHCSFCPSPPPVIPVTSNTAVVVLWGRTHCQETIRPPRDVFLTAVASLLRRLGTSLAAWHVVFKGRRIEGWSGVHLGFVGQRSDGWIFFFQSSSFVLIQ